ncbi:MAG: pyruvate dehydrogenase (acetyl-transferring), homodimeric type, partial [Myxococcales bacterium]|nr:pyruvate dehydrogenase (acetyl-transferring), homodimeric type [Myxococcales bacterium]
VRWNAVAMVVRANRRYKGLGGHLSTYASAATLYEVGFNHFFRGWDDGPGDMIYFQGHAAPGIYARAFLEGRVDEGRLDNFRREVGGNGLSSYPHPRLMPDFWEFPTVSMGLGPINAVYQARFNRYLHNRGILDTSRSRVWAFLGDGETDEPESLGALSLPHREGLDNLIFVVNCNLQRLDGPVRGNGKIIQELEAVFRGAGWHVIKVVWGREWDDLLARDVDGILVDRMNETLDGDFQRYATEDGDVVREQFFGPDPRLQRIVAHLSDQQIERLRRGGHDYRKVYAAYKLATEIKGAPVVILVKTVKGWTLGESAEGSNATHQMKVLEDKELLTFRDVLQLPIPDQQITAEHPPYYHPGPSSDEVKYMVERRRALGGSMPHRRTTQVQVPVPPPSLFSEFHQGSSDQAASTTMAFVRMLRKMLKSKEFGDRVVPIIPDEARTFGMEPLFREFKIYAALGQRYTPVDHKFLIRYTESANGQILEEGITEAGAMASFTAAGTAHSTWQHPMVPFFIFYSMFGFQRVGDSIWAFADQRGRGFLCGATAGRTTLSGEGLQHQDGHSLLHASTVPSCRAYDAAFAYENAVLVEEGLRRMLVEGEDIFYYLTLYNENYLQPEMPGDVRQGILDGLYLLKAAPTGAKAGVELFGSGTILREVLKAQAALSERYGVSSNVWSATSYGELRRDALACERWSRLHPAAPPKPSKIERILAGHDAPIVAASDFVRAVPELIARFVPNDYHVLGTDGFGMS